MKKIIGKNYLHSHPMDEKAKDIDDDHCIIDKKDLEEIQQFFYDNPSLIQWIGKGRIHWDLNTGKTFNIY